MPDISDKPRKFKVWANCPHSQCSNKNEVSFTVPPGLDADEECAEMVDDFIGGHFESGWEEIE